MTEGPSVTLAIVSNNRPRELARLILSLGYQRRRPDEIVIVTDSDPDVTSVTHCPVVVVPFAEANISKARNLAIERARGDVIVFCDDDAVPEFGWLEALTEPFGMRRIGSATGYVRGRNGVDFQWRALLVDRSGRERRLNLQSDEVMLLPPAMDSVLKTVGANCAFRREALVEIGGFDEAIRFYLDDVDVNVRLAANGWMSAIVPRAEVHHSYAAGLYRTSRRVPKSLFEIGASTTYFLAKHLPGEDVSRMIAQAQQREQRRLMRLYGFGLLEQRDVERLMAGFHAGLAEGLTRRPEHACLSHSRETLDLHPPSAAERRVFVTHPFRRRNGRMAAAAAAKAGDEVTLIEVDWTVRSLKVCFDPAGFWRHSVGIFGRNRRGEGKGHRRGGKRGKREIQRIKAQRKFDATGSPAPAGN